jgi:hypothetical protein
VILVNAPKQIHAQAVKTIVRYLAGTADKGTIVRPTKKLNFALFADADFAGLHGRIPLSNPGCAKSRTGYILLLGGFPLIWKSHLQTDTALSTLEAEYSALSTGIRALIPLRELLFEATAQVRLRSDILTTISCTCFEDNQGAYLLAVNQRITAQTKYFTVKYHHFWGYIKLADTNRRAIRCRKVSTKDQHADFFTKGVPLPTFEKNRLYLMGW